MKQIKIFSVITCSFLIVGLLFAFYGCDVSSYEKNIGFSYVVAYAESSAGGEAIYDSHQFSGVSIEENCIALIRSKQELIEFSDNKDLPFFEIKGEDRYHMKQHIYDSELSQKIRSYDEAFFNEKSLVLVFVEFPNVYPAKIDTASIEGEELVVKVARPEADSFLDALSYHTFIIEVDKKSVENKSAKLMIVKKGTADDYLDENGRYYW